MRKKRVFIMALALLMALPVIASAALPAASTIDLPKTGQTTPYATGDDGDIQAGVAWPSPRFTITYCDATGPCTDQSSDCDANASTDVVTDNLTGLVWPRYGNLDGATNWSNALTYANGLSLCGYTDWRLPNVNELESLINAEEANPVTWLNGQGFSNVQSNDYWSSTTYADDTDLAWGVDMYDGYVGVYNKTFGLSVWPVRGTTTTPAELWKTGQTTIYAAGDDGDIQAGVDWSPSTRFTNNGDGTVTDNLTGLIWLKDANCFNGRTWTQALSDANSLADGTCSLTDGSSAGDWRLPNRKELRSLIDYSQHNPVLPSGHPFSNVQSAVYWSSTTYADNTGGAWLVDMVDGFVGVFLKTSSSYYVWPVRAGTVGTFYNLDISKAGSGSGTVTSSPAGIDCGVDCTESYSGGTQVTLTATADPGSTFAGWSGGGCSGTGTCVVTMSADTTVTATFNSAAGAVTTVPTMTEWGMMIFIFLAGLGSVYYLRRRA